MQWIDEAALARWAARIDAREFLPDMVVDLIRATVTDPTRLRFPGGDVSQVRGWDGDLEMAFVVGRIPTGKSKWEFGTGAGAKKASSDYKKRTEKTSAKVMAENTFVLVNLEAWDTPREDIAAWVQARNDEKKWKNVIYIDGVELVHWLDDHPAVAANYARRVLKCAPLIGAISTDEFWESYSTRFNPKLHEKVVIGDRQAIADDLLQKWAGPAQPILLGAETSIEVVAFAVAAIRTAEGDQRRLLENRTLIVESAEAARFLSARENLTFITLGGGDEMSGMLADHGPTLSAVTGVHARRHSMLTRSSAGGMLEGLQLMGFPYADAYGLAHRCGRSLTILQRLIHRQPFPKPTWVVRANELKSLFLAGGWTANCGRDESALCGLAGVDDYASLEELLRPFTADEDPPFDRQNNIWKVRAPVDAFNFYAHLLGQHDLDRLKRVVVQVFSYVTDEPSPDQAFVQPYISADDYSSWLRDGLALTLLVIATMDEVSGLAIPTGTAQQYVDSVLSSLPNWGLNHQSLLALADQTGVWAEAAPSPFLSALESMLGGDRAEMAYLFHSSADSFFGPSSPHVRILWALEVLSWDPKLLVRTALVLGGLAEVDPEPESNLVNRPLNSLRSILLTWAPSTYATLVQRIACLDALIETCPGIAWPLLVKLLPQSHDSATPSQKPKLRDSAPAVVETLTFGVVWAAQNAVVERAIRLAGFEETRVITLIQAFSAFRPDDRASVLSFVDNYLHTLPAGTMNPVWTTLRAEVGRHEFFADSEWSMSSDERARISDVLERYRPTDPLIDDRRLFDEWLPLVSGKRRDNDPEITRAEALDRILTHYDVTGILDLARSAALPGLIGPALNRTAINEAQLTALLQGALDDSLPGDLGIYVSAIGVKRHGEAWKAMLKDRVFPKINRADDRARLLLGWPMDATTWDFASTLGPETYDAYWQNNRALPQDGSPTDFLRAVTEFRRLHRSVEILGAAHFRLKDIPTEVLFGILDEGTRQLSTEAIEGGGTMLSYYLEAAFESLSSREDADRRRIAQLEFAYFPLIERGKGDLVLFEMLASEPAYYVHVLSNVFRGKHAPVREDISEQDRRKAHVSYSLLTAFKTVPGTVGIKIDRTTLASWITGVRADAATRDLTEIADQYIGRVLAHALQDPDESFWPPSAVCAVFEGAALPDIERGFEVECFNKRGAYSKGIHEGGAQEQALADKYERWAAETVTFRRTSAMLARIAESWGAQARHEDERAKIEKMKR